MDSSRFCGIRDRHLRFLETKSSNQNENGYTELWCGFSFHTVWKLNPNQNSVHSFSFWLLDFVSRNHKWRSLIPQSLELSIDYTGSYSDSEIITLEEVGPGLSDEAAINGLSNQLQKGLVTDQTRNQQSKGMIFIFFWIFNPYPWIFGTITSDVTVRT